MSTEQRQRRLSRAAFQWLDGFSSTLRRAVRRESSRRESAPLSWSAFDRLQFVVEQAQRTNGGGEHRSRQRAPSPDFADYRPYQHGDDVRRIDWNVYGRLGVLQLRQTEAQLRVPVLVLLDCSASMHWGEPDKLGVASELALALGRVGLARSDSVSVVCLGQTKRAIGPLSGTREFGLLQEFLNTASSAGKVDITSQVQSILAERAPARRQPGLVVLISDLLNVADPEALFTAIRGASPTSVVLHVISREEAEPEAIGDVDLVDAETGQIVEVGLSVDTIRQYRERYEGWRSELARQCGLRGIRYVQCSTERTVPEIVLSDLRANRVVR